ncbi:1,6-anhydro-N-acetylmuramyl-L-alanine amidase AmpD [Halovibrio sp. HP20-50]|uniref:1,6-anhydro-N-acetylmuramyl-L-alanine amidase AmpD n=1 Tax=Halovibrio sp. HP20-59 TaxID=3080275 RepID=UPI00294B25F8|nr:1,6-anhydro-N-acetylmuramyl-L-alanine amidase AmpD [Halovibrio sp. HP20-59]MEA2116939.1 1,6-anhydro-N-acetylmuramyl-L-alanine amidase AmpD [Halovibrio sp. HP20-59]
MENKQTSDGWWENARRVESPNCDARPADEVSLLLIHAISLPPGQFSGAAIEALFTNQLAINEHPFFADIAHLRVSAHLLIRRDGECVQFVDADQRAWHAGRSCWWDAQQTCWRTALNDFSVGIELEGDDHTPFTQSQYSALVEAVNWLMARYPQLNSTRIVGHAHVAPLRKTDPGFAFDWAYFRQCLEHKMSR